jgi:hypothetical protein
LENKAMNPCDLRSPKPRFLLLGSLLSLAAFSFSAVGCGGKHATGPSSLAPITLEAGRAGTSTVRALRAANLAVSDTDTTHVDVTFTRALLVVRDVRFLTAEDGGEESDSTEVEGQDAARIGLAAADSEPTEGNDGGVVFRGPFVIDLLSHHADSLDTKLVPPGLYERIQGHLQELHEGDVAATPDLAFLIGSTVDLEGTISGDGGGPFTFRARIDDEFQIRGAFTVQSGTPATALLVFDLSRWLVDGEGRFLDPRNPDNAQAIESAIRHAIKVGTDDNHDGEMDELEHSASRL